MSDLSDKALDRQSAKNSDRIEKESATEKREAKIRNSVLKRYDPNLGRWEVQEGNSVIPNCRPITNATLSAGMPVVRKGQLIDQMRNRRKPVEEEAVPARKGNIKYAYITVGSDASKAALYVAGWIPGRSVLIEEWDEERNLEGDPTRIAGNVCLDNLGGDSFIVSYVMTKLDNDSNILFAMFKTAGNAGIDFSYTLNRDEYLPLSSDSAGIGNPYAPQFVNFVNSIGFGNWINHTGQTISSSSTPSGNMLIDVTNLEGLFLSNINLNRSVSQNFTRTPYTVTASQPGGPDSRTISGSTIAYLSPTVTTTTVWFDYGLNVFTTVDRFFTNYGRFYRPLRYNANLNKGLFGFAEYDSGFAGLGFCTPGNINRVAMRNSSGTALPPEANHLAIVNVVKDSNTVSFTSGAIPPIGAALVAGAFIAGGTLVERVEGSIITLSRPVSSSGIGRQMYWGVPNLLTFTGTANQIDVLSSGLSMMFTSDIGFNNDILTKPIKTPVSFFSEELFYLRTSKETVYSPNTATVRQRNNQTIFRIAAASYG